MNFFKKLEKFFLFISSLLFFSIVIITLYQVYRRYVLRSSITWVAELTIIGFIWMTFLGSISALSRDRHLNIDTFTNLVSVKMNKIWAIIRYILITTLFTVILINAIKLMPLVMRTRTSSLRWPRGVIMIPLIICSLFMIIISIKKIIVIIKKEKHEEEESKTWGL